MLENIKKIYWIIEILMKELRMKLKCKVIDC